MNLLCDIRCFILDMDGTFYLGNKILPGALEFMDYMKESGRDVLFLTNNSSKSAQYYADKLKQMGWPATKQDILTSGEATALYLKKRQDKAKLYVVGTPDLLAEFEAHGFTLTDDKPDFVVLGFDTTLTYSKLVTACDLIRNHVPYIATHPDVNCPVENGYIPDCGSFIQLIKASTGAVPQIIGKPNREIIDVVFQKKAFPADRMAMVGDRLYTDIATGKNAGINTVLVLSGETGVSDVEHSDLKPDYIFENLAALHAAIAASDLAKGKNEQ